MTLDHEPGLLSCMASVQYVWGLSNGVGGPLHPLARARFSVKLARPLAQPLLLEPFLFGSRVVLNIIVDCECQKSVLSG